jgi:catechol 2,3-dioxygenase-like lactoylglutathione lyase family enzyme
MAVIRYLVNDVDEALRFYTALGFAVTNHWGPPFAMMQREDLTLWLSGPESSARRPLSDGTAPVPGGWNRLVITVASLDETISSLEASGLKRRSEPVTGPGGKQVLIEDPSGNSVELFQPA